MTGTLADLHPFVWYARWTLILTAGCLMGVLTLILFALQVDSVRKGMREDVRSHVLWMGLGLLLFLGSALSDTYVRLQTENPDWSLLPWRLGGCLVVLRALWPTLRRVYHKFHNDEPPDDSLI